MITPTDRKKLKHLPHRCRFLINEKLEELGYPKVSMVTISNVLNGKWENLQVEEAIYKVNKELSEIKKSIKKPGAVTPGQNL
jgi:hypothetical protein